MGRKLAPDQVAGTYGEQVVARQLSRMGGGKQTVGNRPKAAVGTCCSDRPLPTLSEPAGRDPLETSNAVAFDLASLSARQPFDYLEIV